MFKNDSLAVTNGSHADRPMGKDIAIEARNLTKRYILGEHLNLKKTVSALPNHILGRPGDKVVIEALKDVCFDLRAGRCLGILGENGSGKSTLLQVISGTAVPDGGYVRLRGLRLPLLGIGAGFHPELTGRENIQVFGTILGLQRGEIALATPSIASFAGIGKHLDTPLKRYSSGMKARLSFAVAMRFPADVYIFDEVLAVVDDSFRYRCFEELASLKDAGRTLLFVSHDLPSVRAICNEALWLDKGQVRDHGDIQRVADEYEEAERLRASGGDG